MTGNPATLNGETDLRFDGITLTQNQGAGSLPPNPLMGIVSNIDGPTLYSTAKYANANALNYTGETIVAEVRGPITDPGNGGGNLIRRGQLCCWNKWGGSHGFDLTDGGAGGSNTFMLAIALEDITYGQQGTFLLKGFVSTSFLDMGGAPRPGCQLFMQKSSGAGFEGRMADVGSWAGTGGTDVFRCIGYLVSDTASSGGGIDVIRFDPSTDYII
jgi:hypothetical protein